MLTAAPTATVTSPSWPAAVPAASVIVATHDRSSYLPELFEAVARQVAAPAFELVVADDGSGDDTWPLLERLVAASPFPAKALRLNPTGGPSMPRNTAASAARGAVLAITDDDCLPEPGWLAAVYDAASTGAVVQGTTRPVQDGPAGPWDRSLLIEAPSGLWESCNLGLPRAVFESVGGFPVLDLLGPGGRGFGEDVALGAAAARAAIAAWAPDAVVRHRYVATDYRAHLAAARRLRGLPAVVREVPELRPRLVAGRFASRRSMACDAALAGAVAAVLTARLPQRAGTGPGGAALPVLAAVPWLALVTANARRRWGRPLPVRVVQEAVTDLVAAASLLEGSVRARTPVL